MNTDPARWGITTGYHDMSGQWREVPDATTAAILSAMGAEDRPAPPGAGDDGAVRVVRPGQPLTLPDAGGPWRLHTEDGGSADVAGGLPPDLPLGYHRLDHPDTGRSVLLVVSPGRCHLPPDLRIWGWAAQLYATRSEHSWGIGDLADLGRLARWASGQGAAMILVNPLHATIPGSQQPSPYYPSSRCFRNPIYLRVEDVPGAGSAAADLDGLAAPARALNDDPLIDRDRVWALKAAALERFWERFRAAGGDPGFDRFCAERGDALARFATHCALSEHLDGVWTTWPAEYRRPDSPAVARFAADRADRVGFHQWLQWCTERQLVAAGEDVALMVDLAIGADPAGADAWLWQDVLALDMRVGAPPDYFNTQGQDWGVPPFDPWRLRACGYEPFRRMLQDSFRGAGGVRFDHVMGLFRLFWIPVGSSPEAGAYVHYPHDELLDILALESHRAGAYVVGEDLGTVEDWMRDQLGARDLLSYRLLWFEPDPPERFPHKALAAVTTHDLPTVAGLWSGHDLDEQHRLGLAPNEEGFREIRDRLGRLIHARGDEAADEVTGAVYAVLAQAPSMILTATLEDAAGVEHRPNMPGTVEERPNWSVALPLTLEELERSGTAAAIAAALNR